MNAKTDKNWILALTLIMIIATVIQLWTGMRIQEALIGDVLIFTAVVTIATYEIRK